MSRKLLSGRRPSLTVLLFALVTNTSAASRNDIGGPSNEPPEGQVDGEVVLGRYLALPPQRSLGEWGSVSVDMEASLSTPEEHAHLKAIHQPSDSNGISYQILELVGDSTVKQHVIARYLTAQLNAEASLTLSSSSTPPITSFAICGLFPHAVGLLMFFKSRPARSDRARFAANSGSTQYLASRSIKVACW
jgi:hypothetical protein